MKAFFIIFIILTHHAFRAKYVDGEEMHQPRPSIRVTVSALHSVKEINDATSAISAAFVAAFGKVKTTKR